MRQAETKPLMVALWSWLMQRLEEISAKSSLASAIRYTLGHWEGLTVFLVDGRVEVDNNTVERGIRPIPLGRKNALFAGSRSGGERWAVLASLMNTAKLHKVDPETYLLTCSSAPSPAARTSMPKRVAALELESDAFGSGRGGRVTKHGPRRPRASTRGMSLEQFDAWLQTLKPAPRVDGASMLDGYLTAIIIGPCSIPPDEWFVDLLGERGRIAAAAGAVLAAITVIVARFNAISEGLPSRPTSTRPCSRRPTTDWRCLRIPTKSAGDSGAMSATHSDLMSAGRSDRCRPGWHCPRAGRISSP